MFGEVSSPKMKPKDTWTKRINLILLNRLEERITHLVKVRRFPEAKKVAEKAERVATETFGPNHARVLTYQSNLASITKLISVSENDIVPINSVQDVQPEISHRAKAINWAAFIRVAVPLIFVITLSVVFINQLATSTPKKTQPIYVTNSLQNNIVPIYRVKAEFFPNRRTIEGEEEVFFDNKDSRNEMVFNLFFNRYKNARLNSSEIRRYAFQHGIDTGYINVLWVSYKGNRVPFKKAGETLRINLNNGMFLSGGDSLKIGFKVKIPYIPDRSGGNDHGIWLGNWLPTLNVDSSQHQSTEIGDPFVNIASTYDVTLTTPKEYNLVMSDIQGIINQDSKKIFKGTLENVRDLPIFLNRDYKEAVSTQGNTEIHYYYNSPNNRAVEVLDIAAKAVAYYKDKFGEYPWKQLNIVENDMYLSGMEYSTLFLISERAIGKNLEETVFHEVGHQWFYNIVGSDQYRSAFIDEGLVEFITYYVLERNVPRNYVGIEVLNKDLGQFTSWQQYRDIHYHNGRKLFENLYVAMGKTEFEKFIKEYYDRYKYSLVSQEEFKRFLTEIAGVQLTDKLLQ